MEPTAARPFIQLTAPSIYRLITGVEVPETPESLAYLKYLKEKIVASVNKSGMDADINSPEIHAKALDLLASLDKKPPIGNQNRQQSGGG